MSHTIPILHNSQIISYRNKIIQVLIDRFESSLNKDLIYKISNLLAIDFHHRIANENSFSLHLDNITNNLARYIGNKRYQDDDFASAMSLFIASITPPSDDDNEDKQLSDERDLVTEVVIHTYYPDLDVSLIENMKSLIKELFVQFGIRDALNFIADNPDIIKKRLVQKTSDTKNKQEEIEAIADSLKQEYLVSHKKHLTIKEKISAAILSSLPLTMGLVGIVSSTIAALPDIVIPHLVPSKKEQ